MKKKEAKTEIFVIGKNFQRMETDSKYMSLEWRDKRLSIISRDNNKCTACGSDEFLCVHHTYYVPGVKIWDYPDKSLMTLCESCHVNFHRYNEVKTYSGHPLTGAEYDAMIERRQKRLKYLNSL